MIITDEIKLNPFNLEAALRREPLVTRGGKKVTNFTQIGPMSIDSPFSAYIDGSDCVDEYNKNGRFYDDETSSSWDLFMAPKPKIKLWIIICKYDSLEKIMNAPHMLYQSYQHAFDIVNRMSCRHTHKHEIIEIEIEDEVKE